MINIDLTQKLNSDDPEDVELTIPLFMEEEFVGILKMQYMVEILRGTREIVANDHVKYNFKLDQNDAHELKEVILIAYTSYSGFTTEN